MATPEELQQTIERNRKAIAGVPPSHGGADAKIAQFHSEIFVAASQLAEIASRRLERQTDTLIDLTRSLKIYTVLLFILTGVLVGVEVFHFFERRDVPIQRAP